MSRRAAADAASGRPRPPSLVRYAWGSWLCNVCDGVNRPEATRCEVRPTRGSGAVECLGLRKYSKRYAEPVDLNTAPEWYRQEVAAQHRAAAKQQKRRHTQSVLDAQRLALRTLPCVEPAGSQEGLPVFCPRGDDCITRGMPRPADDRAESDDSSEDDSDWDEVRRSIRASLEEARQVLRPKLRPSRPRLSRSAVKRACRKRAARDTQCPPASCEAAQPQDLLLQQVWSIARRIAHRVLHALNGNIAWRMIAAVALAPIALKVEQGAVAMVGDVSTAVSVAVQDIVDESRIVVTRTISVAGAFISVVLLMVVEVSVWFIARAVLNRLAHYVTGNPSQVSAELESYNNNGKAVYKVQGKLGVHKVFVQGGSGACGCKAFINEGVCGHVYAALLTHQQFLGRSNLGVLRTPRACPRSLRRFAEGSRRLATPVRQACLRDAFRVLRRRQGVPVLASRLPRLEMRRSTPSRRRLRVLPRPQLELSP